MPLNLSISAGRHDRIRAVQNYLRTHRLCTCRQIADALGEHPKSIRRDLTALRKAGVVIEYGPDGLRLKKGVKL